MFREPLSKIKRARPTDIMRVKAFHSRFKSRIRFRFRIGLFKIEDQRHQSFSDETSAEFSEMAGFIRSSPEGIERLLNGHVLFLKSSSGAARRLDKCPDLCGILDPRRRLDAGRHINPSRMRDGDGLAHIRGVKPS